MFKIINFISTYYYYKLHSFFVKAPNNLACILCGKQGHHTRVAPYPKNMECTKGQSPFNEDKFYRVQLEHRLNFLAYQKAIFCEPVNHFCGKCLINTQNRKRGKQFHLGKQYKIPVEYLQQANIMEAQVVDYLHHVATVTLPKYLGLFP